LEEARRKLRIWLIFVVAAAVIVGCIYYFSDVKDRQNISDGTLVRAEWTESGMSDGGEE